MYLWDTIFVGDTLQLKGVINVIILHSAEKNFTTMDVIFVENNDFFLILISKGRA